MTKQILEIIESQDKFGRIYIVQEGHYIKLYESWDWSKETKSAFGIDPRYEINPNHDIESAQKLTSLFGNVDDARRVALCRPGFGEKQQED